MSVISVSFISLLVSVFILYYLMPRRFRWMVLLAASTVFYLASGAGSFVYMLITSVTVYAAARFMQHVSDEQKAYFKANKLTREEKAAVRKKNRRIRKACFIGALAVSLGGKVRVNSISPGWIDTDYTVYEGPDAVQQPAGRVGNPLDIANMVLFLCSDKAGFITGENICIDGGQTRLMIYHNDYGWTYQP